MTNTQASDRRSLPSVDAVMRSAAAQVAAARFGHQTVVTAVRQSLAELRRKGLAIGVEDAAALALAHLEAADLPRLKPVYNLTGTAAAHQSGASTCGGRGDRGGDDHDAQRRCARI